MEISSNEEFKSEILQRASYGGRAMAFYPDGRDYGMVTLIPMKIYVVKSHIFVFDEKTDKIMDGVAIHCEQTKHQCGRIYEYIFRFSDGEELYLSRTC